MPLKDVAAAVMRSAGMRSPCLSPSCAFSSSAGEARADLSAQLASELHRSPYPGGTVSRAFWSFDQLRIGDPLAVCGGQQRINTIAFLGVATIIAPREFVQITVKVLRADPMVDSEHLPLEVRPRALQPVDMAEVVADVFTEAVVDGVVVEPAFQADVARGLIAHDVGAGLNVLNHLPLYRLGAQIVHPHRADIAIAFHHAEHGGFSSYRPCVLPLPFVFVALFAADEGFVDFDHPAERLVEGFGFRRLAEAMRHEPCGLLSDANIASKLSAGDTLLVTGDQPDSNEPLFQWQLCILENRSDLDREPLSAVAALVRFVVREVVDFRAAAVGTERPARPADRAEVPDAALLVWEGFGQSLKGLEVLQHARLQPTLE